MREERLPFGLAFDVAEQTDLAWLRPNPWTALPMWLSLYSSLALTLPAASEGLRYLHP
jgi:hypothetical protein